MVILILILILPASLQENIRPFLTEEVVLLSVEILKIVLLKQFVRKICCSTPTEMTLFLIHRVLLPNLLFKIG